MEKRFDKPTEEPTTCRAHREDSSCQNKTPGIRGEKMTLLKRLVKAFHVTAMQICLGYENEVGADLE